jgi:XTP/dITP diphosphohydrolase
MKKILIVATTNKHKIVEIGVIAEAFGYTAVSRAQAGVPDFEVEEDGETFEANSLLKAKAIFEYTGQATVADDSGLIVDALGGAPGVWSARFADHRLTSDAVDFAAADRDAGQMHRDRQDRANNAKLLRLLAESGVPWEDRTARFVSVVTLLDAGKPPLVCRGEVEGRIAFAAKGVNGFGYDPLFVPRGHAVTFGEFSPEEKNKISHRFRALEGLRGKLRK